LRPLRPSPSSSPLPPLLPRSTLFPYTTLFRSYVQFGQADGVDGVHADGVFHQHRIEPATAAFTAGGGAFFLTYGRQVLADFVEQLGRERTRTHAGGVSLGNTQNLIQIQRAYAGTGGHTTSGGVGRGEIGRASW